MSLLSTDIQKDLLQVKNTLFEQYNCNRKEKKINFICFLKRQNPSSEKKNLQKIFHLLFLQIFTLCASFATKV